MQWHFSPSFCPTKQMMVARSASRVSDVRHAYSHIIIVQFSYMPAIATEMFFVLTQSFTTTCFGPYGPSSGGTQHQYKILSLMQISYMLLQFQTKTNTMHETKYINSMFHDI
jgi:TRAP-type mannitol/chloroaromatic compound transport system permease small subunit